MTSQEIVRLTNNYIGVSGGYLGDFSYRTHKEFYPLFCDLNIDPDQIQGTTRHRFQEILRTSPPEVQAKIIRGILTKYPSDPSHLLRTPEIHADFQRIVLRLEGMPVSNPAPVSTSEVVKRAIYDAETLIKTTGATSGVDRVHTALHGYMKSVCDNKKITYAGDPTILALFTLIRNQHPAFTKSGPRTEDITKICRAIGVVMDSLNPIRNHASIAHPNDNLLEEPEAMLVINITRTILHYIDAKLI